MIDLSPLWISLKTGIVATCFSFFIGIFAARRVMKCGSKTKSILDALLTLPLVLPPTVAGFFLLMIFSLRRPFGSFLYLNFNLQMVQTWYGCVVAAAVISFPLMYRNARGAFEQVDTTMIDAAKTLGCSDLYIFWKIIMPLAAPGIRSGTILAFARAIGEYGATVMLAGNVAGKTRTLATAIASETASGNYSKAGFWVTIILGISFIMVILLNLFSAKATKSIGRWD